VFLLNSCLDLFSAPRSSRGHLIPAGTGVSAKNIAEEFEEKSKKEIGE
jgi:hypothetical protein